MFVFAALRRVFAPLMLVLVLVAAGVSPIHAQLYSTRAKQALLIDADTNTVLFAKDHNTRIPPASLAKLMTMEVVFSRLRSGALALDDTFYVSEDAWRRGGANSGGSTMFAELGSEVPLEDLIRGVIVQSANDGCIIIAEGIAGSEEAFAELMNERARELGLNDSHFRNATGLPDPEQHVSINDLAKLARHMISAYPDFYRYYSELEFTWNGITQRNRNPLLRMKVGADGMKTGYTEASGYAIVGSARRDGQRLVAVLSGMASLNQRKEEARKILDWGFRAFEKIVLYGEDEIIGEADVYGGEKDVPMVGYGPVSIYLPLGNRDKLRARIVYTGPLMPPVEAGTHVATLRVWIGDTLSQETPLYAAETVEKGSIAQQATDAIKELVLGLL